MSIDTEHQNPIQTTATASTSDQKGRGKEKEVDPSVHEDMSDPEESGGDTTAEYPFEQFLLPPGDNAHVPNTTPSVDSPLMDFRYPPPPPLANDPTRYTQMVSDVHRNRTHVNTQLDRALARNNDDEALAQVTLADVELKAERDEMQDLLNRMGSVAGKNFVRKMVRRVERSLKTAHEKPDNHYEEDRRDSSGYEDSSGSDEDEVEHQDAEEEDLGGDADKSEEGPQDAENEQYNHSGNDGSYEGSEFPPASCSPSSMDCPQQCLHESFNEGKANFWESSELPPADESPHSFPKMIWHQLNRPDWRRGDITDDEYSSGEDETSRKWTDLSPAHKCGKRHLEFEEDEKNDSPENSPRKKFKETSSSPLKGVKLFPIPTRSFYPPEKTQATPIDQEHHDNSDEENEVENSLALEHEPVPPWPYLPQLNRLERDPYRVRQNSRGEPELYVPGRLAIEFS
ncbi:hypothetical protein BDR04DRAFT_1092586 [Suillus decipiens]|nr:hypothetical protein BDR04DRAFT_1092586 [Suillus decipiens]